MTSPSKFIASSDFASTPAPLAGAKEITFTTPASQYVSALNFVEFHADVAIGEDFDTLLYILTCDELPDLCAYNWALTIDDLEGQINASVVPMQNNARLLISYSAIANHTFSGAYTFRAVVVPIKSPYNQS